MRERLKNPPAPEFIHYILQPLLLKDAQKSFKFFNAINKAHLLMLVKQKIIDPLLAKQIFKAIRETEKRGAENIPLDPSKEDLSSNIEAFIMNQCGADIGGRLHTGRSRNDLGGTVTRMLVRQGMLESCRYLNQLRAAVLALANKYTETVCAGYTCAQPAEPITLAYYFAAHLYAMERDFARLAAAYERLNLCPLGSGAMAATTFNIDRTMVAHLLGFAAETPNSLDGIGARDYILEILAALSTFMINLSRMCQDLYMWATDEFSLIEVDSSVAMCSSIMPQKKNPVTLEHVKAKAAHVQAAYISAAGSLKNTPYTQVRDSSIESAHLIWDAFNEVEASTQLMIVTLNMMRINEERMLDLAKSNFCTVSELANTLVRECDISFRQAHSTVARLVAYLLEHEMKPGDIDSNLLRVIAKEVIGKDIAISEEKIKIALDPQLNAFSRDVSGGPAPKQVCQQLMRLSKQLDADTALTKGRIEALNMAEETLDSRVDDFLST
ncbi:MAG: argininosuccinate lyase [Dehalobacterium sp.]